MPKVNIKKINFIIILAIFLISIIIRIPNLNRPLSNHHEWLTSLSVRIISIFYDNGASKYNFAPITTYEGPANKNIDNTATLFMPKDTNGNYYYTSHLPFAYLFPYFIFKSINVPPTILGIQVFSLILHFISAYFIFLIISLLNKNSTKDINWTGILGFTIYTFLPLNLWFHSNIYMAEIFVQPLFIIEIYLFLKIIFSESIKNHYYWLLGIVNFLIVYTEWLGALLAGTIGIYLLFKIGNKKYRKILYIMVATTLSPLLLTFYQYSLIDGFSNLLTSYKNKYALRSGFSNSSPANSKFFEISAWSKLIQHYILNFSPFLILLSFLCILLKDFKKILFNRRLLLLAYITIIPVILHHLIFFSATIIHDFFLLKDSVYVSLFGAIVIGYLTAPLNKKVKLLIFGSIILIGASLSTVIYAKYNASYLTSYKIIGEQIKKVAKEDEVVFLKFDDTKIKQIDITPQYIIYAQRNLALWENADQANDLISANKLNKGIIFTINNGYKVSNISRVNLEK